MDIVQRTAWLLGPRSHSAGRLGFLSLVLLLCGLAMAAAQERIVPQGQTSTTVVLQFNEAAPSIRFSGWSCQPDAPTTLARVVTDFTSPDVLADSVGKEGLARRILAAGGQRSADGTPSSLVVAANLGSATMQLDPASGQSITRTLEGCYNELQQGLIAEHLLAAAEYYLQQLLAVGGNAEGDQVLEEQ